MEAVLNFCSTPLNVPFNEPPFFSDTAVALFEDRHLLFNDIMQLKFFFPTGPTWHDRFNIIRQR
jgi:hypothetical protein